MNLPKGHTVLEILRILELSDQRIAAGLQDITNKNTVCPFPFELKINSKELFSVSMAYEIFRTYLMLKIIHYLSKIQIELGICMSADNPSPSPLPGPGRLFPGGYLGRMSTNSNMHTGVSKGMQARPFFRGRWSPRRDRRGSDWYPPCVSL